MKYYSLNNPSATVDFKEATLLGQAPDRGLYFPENIPVCPKELIQNIENLDNQDIAYQVIRPYVGDTIPEEKLFEIVRETTSFPIPLVPVNDRIFSLELFHGPTLAFKDVGARFMSRCLAYFVEQDKSLDGKRKLTILVATSGDTGGAVANGFFDVEGINVVILYPSGKVSSVQEKQLTTLGKNIQALEVLGSFDDCQQMVKQAFGDKELSSQLRLSSANSINVARWLPQQFYYFFAYKQWKDKNSPPVISVPSGNFGNICAGMLAAQSGLPVKHFIAACNANDVVTRYLDSGVYETKVAVPTLSNAMDVGDPSNFIRIMEIFGRQYPLLKKKLSSFSITDAEVLDTIKWVYDKYNYLLDPHGAVGYLSLHRYLLDHPGQKGIFLETAHPVKFPESVESATGSFIPIPSSVQQIINRPKQSQLVRPEYSELRNFLLR